MGERSDSISSRTLITGGCGFIGSAVARRLYKVGHPVRVADICGPSHLVTGIDYRIGDLRDAAFCTEAVKDCHTVIHFAANMGGMGTIHSANDATLYADNHIMTLHLLRASVGHGVKRFFFASSACVYPETPAGVPVIAEDDIAFAENHVWATGVPPHPQGLYGLDKLNTELVLAQFTSKLDIRIARFHNVFGPGGAWFNGREKAPAAILRKAIVARRLRDMHDVARPTFEMWGDGTQRRSFLYIDDCVSGVLALLNSSCSTPVNIGSDRAVSILRLAELALECVRLTLDDVEVVYDKDKPLGVGARNSDNTFAFERLHGWSPTTSLEDGMKATCRWMEGELDKLSPEPDLALLRTFSRSQLVDFDKAVTFALLLPITSRLSSPSDSCLRHLERFISTLIQTTRSERLGVAACGVSFSFKVYLLIDYDDHFLLQNKDGMNRAERVFLGSDIPITTILGYHEPGRVCSMWRQCARKAYADPQNTYFVLFGDDVELDTDMWMTRVHCAFEEISKDSGFPMGFGCVAFRDMTFPGMPTFPVLHRTHLDIFGGEVIPENFVNQDGDPFVFQLYRRWGCARMLQDVRLRNTVGGSLEARYRKRSTLGWTYGLLDRATAITDGWLVQELGHPVEQLLTIDVVVPSFRIDLDIIKAILTLKPSSQVSTMFIIIVDNPFSLAADELEREYGHHPNVRIRRNKTNLGASASRNRGIEESAAQWIIFLDDDVQPEPNILLKAEESVRAHPHAAGFVGNVYFPPPNSVYKSAVHLAGVTYFWNIAEKIGDDVPWGVTANLIARRNDDGVSFDLGFPKTGGGEDIDFCVRKVKRRGMGDWEGKEDFVFHSAPDVRVVHPWWRDGRRNYGRFFGWGLGDSGLLKKFPQLTYRDYTPNSSELFLISLLIAGLGVLIARVDVLLLALRLGVATFAGNISHDLYRLLCRRDFDVKTLPGRAEDRQLVAGLWLVLAVMESTVIRMFSEAGKTIGTLKSGDMLLLGRRFDWFVGRWGDGPRRNEIRNGVERVLVILILLKVIVGIDF